MRSLAQLFLKKEKEGGVKEIDEKTILYITGNTLLEEYGNKGRANIQPISFSKGRLSLKVSGSIWESEILLQRHDLRMKINEACGKNIIEEISVKK